MQRKRTGLVILVALAVAAPLVSADAPRGVRVRWCGGIDKSPVAEDRQFIEWGTAGKTVEERLAKKCYSGDWSGEESCLLGLSKYGGWWADFGDDYPRSYETTLYFIDGQFFRYFVQISPERFGSVEGALVDALGQPGTSQSSEVQNRMGANFDQEIRIWEFDDVDVYLVKRAGKVTEGLLSVTFKPLAEKVPKKKSGSVPNLVEIENGVTSK